MLTSDVFRVVIFVNIFWVFIALFLNNRWYRYSLKLNDEWADICEKLCSEIEDYYTKGEEENCDGCKHSGKWENEVEYGCTSPCTRCKRRVMDNYER